MKYIETDRLLCIFLITTNRRAQENASVLGGVAVERNLLWEEFKMRLIAHKERAQIQTVPIVPAGPASTL
jgi:proline dehydrogenase